MDSFCLLLCILAFPLVTNAFFNTDAAHPPEEISAWIDLSENYQTLSATNKSDLLWLKVLQSKYSNDELLEWKIGAGGIFQLIRTGLVSLAPAFTCNVNNSDILPVNRARGIHNLGVVGRVQWTMLDNVQQNDFTGLLAKGASAPAIIRLSLATPPGVSGLMPGMGLKLFVDGRQSVNTVANFDLNGQGTNKNFFFNMFRTSLPGPTKLATQILMMRFEQVESPAQSLSVRDFARFTPQGDVVNKPVYPFMLEFRPVPRVANLIASDSPEEFRLELIRQLSPGPFLDVYAASRLNDSGAFKIGELTLETGVLASKFGDERLCFKHQRNNSVRDEF